jgi:hypothetical protein
MKPENILSVSCAREIRLAVKRQLLFDLVKQKRTPS